MTVGVRDRADPLTGWRYWQLVPASGQLRSVSQRQFLWAPLTPLRATCVQGRHRAPADGCNCGIYAAPDLQTLREHGLCLAPGGLVVGLVDLWGRVSVDERGCRGEYAYPRALSLVEGSVAQAEQEAVARILAAYGCPVDAVAAEEALGEVSAAQLAFQAMALTTSAPRPTQPAAD